MSNNPMDLDSSLDDLIKQRRTTKKTFSKHQSSHSSRGTLPHQQKGKITKHIQRKHINTQLPSISTGPPINQRSPKADPSKIIITKAIKPIKTTTNISTRVKPSNTTNAISTTSTKKVLSSMLQSRLGKKTEEAVPEERITRAADVTRNDRPILSIRGRSHITPNTTGFSIKGESGPTTVLLTGLDKGANSDDVKVACESFGSILHCEVLRDRLGNSFGEAEIEFSTKTAALDCIAKLDNALADGQIVRALLRESKIGSGLHSSSSQPTSFASKQIRSIITTASSQPSGRMYADQMGSSRYDMARRR
ncbi:hypothetical protein BDB01DRAFT_213147 [Pilobolus umbonatus]|nr:hypothetical protein BDB01DRAFT_213147 [Pilobolus umbonatus]